MVESMATRIGRIISGTVNQLIDAAENAAPLTVLEEALRELDQATHDVRAELGKIEAQSHLASKRLAEENNKHEELSEKIRLAIGEGREDLAETAIERLLDVEAQIPILERTLGDAARRREELEAFIAALKGRRREMAEEIKRFRESQQSGSGDAQGGGDGAPPTNKVDAAVERANSAFDRVLEKTAGLPGSGSVPDAETARKMAELDALSDKAKVRDRLARFRSESS